MEETGSYLGPLQLVGGVWGFGDATRPDTHWVEVRPDGLRQHVPGSARRSVPWNRIMTGIWITWGNQSWSADGRGVYTLKGTVAPGVSGWMRMTLRHPYEDDQLRFDQHTRPYRAVDALRLEYLLRHLVAHEELPLLGDPQWVGRAVAHLGREQSRWTTYRSLRRSGAEAVAAAGAAGRRPGAVCAPEDEEA
ncbi:hypothetical protein ACGFNQ_12595 [Streptomyces asoensis]|uniref:hypothetical protein n=1 Tax=Streptomyces asoensis TaxID=249586 RepID=UPI00371D46DB